MMTAKRKRGVSRRKLLKAGCIGAGAFAAFEGSSTLRFCANALAATPIVRREFRALSTGDKAKFAEAVRRLKNKASGSSSEWLFNANFHAQFCGDDNANVHSSWRFFTWHRAYMRVFELALQAAMEDPALSLPYWNYVADPSLPAEFTDRKSPLYHSPRVNLRTLPRSDFFSINPRSGAREFLGGAMSLEQFENRRTASGESLALTGFGGGPRGNGNGGGTGMLESSPHNAVHRRLGGQTGDMGDPLRAARDPIFLLHHAQTDRVWEIWRQARAAATGKLPEPYTAEFLQPGRPHVFALANGTTLQFEIINTLEAGAMGFAYDNLTVPVAPAELVASARASERGLSAAGVAARKDFDLPEEFAEKSARGAFNAAGGGEEAVVLVLGGLVLPENRTGPGITIYVSPLDANGNVIAGQRRAAAQYNYFTSGGAQPPLAFDITPAVSAIAKSGRKVRVEIETEPLSDAEAKSATPEKLDYRMELKIERLERKE